MTSLTTPDNLVIWTVSDPDALSTASAAMQNSVQAALTSNSNARQIKSYKWANITARNAQAGMTEGDIGYQMDTKTVYLYFTAWKPWNSEWITYAPTVAGITLGTGGTAYYAYKYSAGLVKVKWKIVLGTSGTWSVPSFTLPFPVETASTGQFGKLGMGSLTTFSGFWDVTVNYVDASTGVRMYCLTGSPITFSVISATSPVAVSSGTALLGQLEYTPA
jgi:hypothetical protein